MQPRSTRTALALALALLGWAGWACRATPHEPPPPAGRWWKGNTHTHTLWSDGDGAPELIVDRYRERGYDFLVLSDHNLLSRGERWFPIDGADKRLPRARVDELRARFGDAAVEEREIDGKPRMRLKTLDELRTRFESPEEFLLIEGEEVTDSFQGKQVHINALNVADVIAPQKGDSLRAVLERNLAAIVEHGRANGRPVLAHVNHPNFVWSLTWQDLASLAHESFFEVYNGHPEVHNDGDATRPGTEEMWDLANTLRLRELGLPPLFALASDDSHHYFGDGEKRSNSFRGWICVRSAALDTASLLAAMRVGDFYASTGVELADVRRTRERYVVDITTEPGVTYTTRFTGVLADGGERAIVLAETDADPAVYEPNGTELFVRATVISSLPQPNPAPGEASERAWCQPWVPSAAREK